MAPKKPAEEEDDEPPPSSDDEEKQQTPVKVPPVKLPKAAKDETVTAPLIDKAAAPASDAPGDKPSTPREKFREKSKASPRGTDAGAGDPVEAAKQTAGAAWSEVSNARLPTREEAAASLETAKRQAAETAEKFSNFGANMMADLPPKNGADASKYEAAFDDIGPAGALLKPLLLTVIKAFLFIQPWTSFIIKWGYALYDILPKNLTYMAFGATLCCARAPTTKRRTHTHTHSTAARATFRPSLLAAMH